MSLLLQMQFKSVAGQPPASIASTVKHFSAQDGKAVQFAEAQMLSMAAMRMFLNCILKNLWLKCVWFVGLGFWRKVDGREGKPWRAGRSL